jgi:hypothetical protein
MSSASSFDQEATSGIVHTDDVGSDRERVYDDASNSEESRQRRFHAVVGGIRQTDGVSVDLG